EGLNSWLKKNGFPTEDPDHMKYFVEKGFTFLAIKVNPMKGESAVKKAGEAVPLHLSFRSEQPYYPLRFSSRQGQFDLNLYVFTSEKFDFRKSKGQLAKLNWNPPAHQKTNVKASSSDLPASLKEALEKAAPGIQHRKSWKANLIRTSRVNKGKSIAAWKEDVFFSTRRGLF
ncbi:MAG: DUF2330 domain-containing protein, partial [Verrucomicrobiota bacterium]